MADISDVTAYLKSQALAAVYPNGTSQPSVANMDVRIMEGWPLASQLELDLAGNVKDPNTGVVSPRPNGKLANVSIFPSRSTGHTYQNLNKTYTIVPPAINLAVSASNNVISVTGQPAAGEYITIVADRGHVYSASGATTAAILTALATAAQANYPSASANTAANPPTLTIPVGFQLTVRQGGVATLGRATHRQTDCVMVTVWAPDHNTRATLAKAIDVLIKQTTKPSMPDTSEALVLYAGTYITDEQQTVSVYRRDLLYDVTYATLQQFPGYVITSTQVSIISAVDSSTVATATT